MGLLDIFRKKKPDNKQNDTDITVIDIAGTARINHPIYVKQINESTEIIRTTTNPETFFSRYKFAIERLTELEGMRKYVKLTCNPLEIRQNLINDKDKYITLLINRMLKKTEEKISTLKQQNAIENNINKFLSSVEDFSDEMGEQSKKYFKEVTEYLKAKYINNTSDADIEKTETARMNLPIYARQVNESIQIISNTTNPNTFFYRYGFIIERLTEMEEMQKCINAKSNALEVKQSLINDKDKHIVLLIKRMFEKTKEEVATLKHQYDIERSIDAFLYLVENFKEEMGELSEKYFNEVTKYLKTKYINNSNTETKQQTLENQSVSAEEKTDSDINNTQKQNVNLNTEENYNYGSYLVNRFKEIYKITEKSYPSCEGLEIPEMTKILEKISYSGRVTIKNPQDYPKWFDYELSIKDPYQIICKLRDEGYVYNCNPETVLKQMKVSELKEELSNQGLSVKGNKADLISRLINEGEPLSSFLPEVIRISDKGEKFLENNSEIWQINLIKSYGLSTEQFQSFKNKNPDSDVYSIIIQVLTEQDAILAEKNEISMSRVKKCDIAEAFEQKGDKKMALQYYIFSAYYALCEFIEPIDVEYKINGFLSLRINELKDYYSDSMIDNCYKWNIGGYYKKPDKNYFTEEINKLIK